MFFEMLESKVTVESKSYEAILASTGLRNIFNPSICKHKGSIYIAFRASSSRKDGGFDSYLLTISDVGGNSGLENLSVLAAGDGVEIVCDPKLLTLGGELWVTFNTGWHKDENHLYLANLSGGYTRAIQCHFSGRRAVEKNWVFFIRGEFIYALYSLDEPILMSANISDLVSEKKIIFEQQERFSVSGLSRGYTLGTQLVRHGDYYYFVAHKKLLYFGRRIYFGVISRFSFDRKHCERISPYLIHSIASLFGSSIKYNKNLISCTYFSGIQTLGDGTVLLSYGVNDMSFGVAVLRVEGL